MASNQIFNKTAAAVGAAAAKRMTEFMGYPME